MQTNSQDILALENRFESVTMDDAKGDILNDDTAMITFFTQINGMRMINGSVRFIQSSPYP